MSGMKKLNAKNLKQALWETMNRVKSGRMQPGQGDAVASQAREILRAVKVQMQIAKQAEHDLSRDVIEFGDSRDS